MNRAIAGNAVIFGGYGRQESHMSTSHKAENAVQNAKGKVKEGVGHVTGDEQMEAEGEKDQAAAHVKQAAEKAKDAVKHGAEVAKGKVKEGVGRAAGTEHLTAEGQVDQDAARLKADLDR